MTETEREPRPAAPATAGRLRDIRVRADRATPGPWRSHRGHGRDRWAPKGYRYVAFGRRGTSYTTSDLVPADAEFIAHARTDVPALLGALEAERALADRLANVLYALNLVAAEEHPDLAAVARERLEDHRASREADDGR